MELMESVGICLVGKLLTWLLLSCDRDLFHVMEDEEGLFSKSQVLFLKVRLDLLLFHLLTQQESIFLVHGDKFQQRKRRIMQFCV